MAPVKSITEWSHLSKWLHLTTRQRYSLSAITAKTVSRPYNKVAAIVWPLGKLL